MDKASISSLEPVVKFVTRESVVIVSVIVVGDLRTSVHP